MGEVIRASPVIVIGDIIPAGPPQFERILIVREVVRGDALPGERLTIPLERSSNAFVPQQAQNIAVLFGSDWKKTPPPIQEVYQQPQEISALRVLIPIYDLPQERAQLLALQARTGEVINGEENPIFASQLIADFAWMRESQNFDIVLSSFARLDTAHQADLLQLLERIGDRRALPLLIGGLRSPQRAVSYAAWHALNFYFPGAPGVTEAFRVLAQNPNPETRDSALRYLRQHDPASAATLPQPQLTSWQQAQQYLKSGDQAAAREAFFALVEAEKEANWGTLSAAQTLLPLLDEKGKTRLRGLVARFLERETGNYLYAQQGAALLRSMPDESNTAALLHLLHDPGDASYSSWDGAAREATFALVDLGAEAKRKATARVLEKIKTRLVPGAQLRYGEATLYFCQLAWLADDATWQSVGAQLPEPFATEMKQLQPIRDAATSRNEAAALSALLPDEANRWQNDSNRWIIARLGDLRDPVGAAPLFAELSRARFGGNAPLIEAALVAIGGPLVESGAQKLLESEHEDLQLFGMDILRALQGDKMRPLLRRILTENAPGDRAHALFLLGYIGRPEDLPLLLPLTDFWKSDRALQSRATTAVIEIRDRFGLDSNAVQ